MSYPSKLGPYLLLVVLISLPLGCKTVQEPEGYRVMSYDARTQQWTIMRTGTFSNGEGKPATFLRKRLIVVCDAYQWGNNEMVKGADACHLNVGRLYAMNLKTGNFEDVSEMSGQKLAITEGEGNDRVWQMFSILKYEVLP